MTVEVNLPQDRESQIAFAVSLYPLWGEKAPEICDVCGGIKDHEQSKTRRCLCDEHSTANIAVSGGGGADVH